MDDCSDSEASPNADAYDHGAESFSTAHVHSRSNFDIPIMDGSNMSKLPPAALDVSGSFDEPPIPTPQSFASLSASLLDKLVCTLVKENPEGG
jgi:hypothetical protein